MSTRSSIAAKLSNGQVGIIYCHFDGDPKDGVGSRLQQDYQDQTKIDGLIALGNLSILDASIDCPEGHSFDDKKQGYCVAYGRDREEEDQEAMIAEDYKTVKQMFGNHWQEFEYYWDGKNWMVDGKPLVDVLNASEEEIPHH